MPAGGAEWHVDDRMWALVGVSRPLAAVVVRGVVRAPSLWDGMSKFLECLSAFLTYMPAPRCVAVRELRFRFPSYKS